MSANMKLLAPKKHLDCCCGLILLLHQRLTGLTTLTTALTRVHHEYLLLQCYMTFCLAMCKCREWMGATAGMFGLCNSDMEGEQCVTSQEMTRSLSIQTPSICTLQRAENMFESFLPCPYPLQHPPGSTPHNSWA